MVQEMKVQATLEQGISFAVTTESGHRFGLDGAPDVGGENAGPRPTEVLLGSLAGCAGLGIIGILRKMRQQVSAYEIRIQAERSEQRPHIFTHITVEHILTGHQIQPAAVERAIALNEERYCSVSAMLAQSSRITQTYQIHENGE